MRKFVIRTFSFLTAIIVICTIVDWCITQGLKKSENSLYQTWNHIFQGEIKADVIINGSSKAEVQISPSKLDSILGINSYNLGMTGYGFHFQLVKYNSYQVRNIQPKLIIQILGEGAFRKRADLYNYQQFLPYLHDSAIRNNCSLYEGFTWKDYYLPSYRYFRNKEIGEMGLKLFFLEKKDKPDSVSYYKGYAPNPSQWDGKYEEFVSEYHGKYRVEVDSICIDLFNTFLEEQIEKEIKIVLVYPPQYYKRSTFVTNTPEIIQSYENIANKHNIPFLNYMDHPIGKDTSYFYNSMHLNTAGSEKFSAFLATELKTLPYLEGMFDN